MKVYVVYCHPDPESFTAAVRQRAVDSLRTAGHDVVVTDLYDDEFDPTFSLPERIGYLIATSIDPAIAAYCERLQWCEALMFIYPTWWSGQPAMMKGWLDRVLIRGVAWELPEGATRRTPQLTNVRRVVAITTHGSSRLVNLIEGETGRRVISRAVRLLCHRFARTTWLALYDIDRSTAADRQAFLDRVDHRMTRL